ncbi:MAG: hypothetical protein JXA33_25330 [Anaerolineae bacterium]|nr:hypothetical protein [Anaerolineae bacterium]
MPENHHIAETWEVCDRPGESSIVINGPLVGKTLHTLIAEYGEALLGQDIITKCGIRFPLLIKFLDASNVLGEQAHHSDALAAKHGLDDPGKTEAWYMLKTRPGATIHCGQRDDTVTSQTIHDALLDGTIRNEMREYAVQPGDAFLLYAGTMHYSAGGVLFYEIMQNSDVYIGLRLPDTELSDAEREAKVRDLREGIHLEPGFEVKIPPVTIREGGNARTFVFACTYFALERLDLHQPYLLECDGERFFVLSQIEGTSTLIWENYQEHLEPGHTSLLPASLGIVQIKPGQSCALLKTYVPNLEQNIIRPLRQAGIPQQAILGLGGKTKLNPLMPNVY